MTTIDIRLAYVVPYVLVKNSTFAVSYAVDIYYSALVYSSVDSLTCEGCTTPWASNLGTRHLHQITSKPGYNGETGLIG